MRNLFGLVCLSVALTSNPGPAGAEWLSLLDGGLLETKGPWKEKGKTIVYTSTAGALVSVRASEVDLSMSKALSAKLKTLNYIDLGAVPNPGDPEQAQELIDHRGDAERGKLQQFVQDPNAPRVAGTLSAQSNETALRNLDGQLQSYDDSQFDRDNAACTRFEGSTHSACLMRSGIASEIRREEAQAAQEAKDAARKMADETFVDAE